MGVNKNIIRFIVDNIDEILEHNEVREAIIKHDVRKKAEEEKKAMEIRKLKQAKIDVEEEKNNLEEYNKRIVNNGKYSFRLFYEDFLVNYLYTLKGKGIEPTVITQAEVMAYAGVIVQKISAYIDLDDMRIQEFYKKYNAFFKRIADDNTEIVGELSTADLSKMFHIYLPYEIMPIITDEDVRKEALRIYENAHKTYKYTNKKKSS